MRELRFDNNFRTAVKTFNLPDALITVGARLIRSVESIFFLPMSDNVYFYH